MLNLRGNASMQSTCGGECIAKKESVLRDSARGQNRDRTFCHPLAIRLHCALPFFLKRINKINFLQILICLYISNPLIFSNIKSQSSSHTGRQRQIENSQIKILLYAVTFQKIGIFHEVSTYLQKEILYIYHPIIKSETFN